MPDKTLTMYWLPHCTTCKKAVKYLENSGYPVMRFRNIKTEPLNRKEVKRLAKLVGGAVDLFSRRARKYIELNLASRTLSTEEMIEFMSREYTFIKRPVLVCGEQAVAGFTRKLYDRFLEQA